MFAAVRECNRYFDARRPWETRSADPQACRDTLLTCVQLISCLCTLLRPFLPFSSGKVADWLGIDAAWRYHKVQAGRCLPVLDILFDRLDPSVADRERNRLAGEQGE